MTGPSKGTARRDRLYGLVFLAVGLGAVYGAIRLGLGTPESPEPGFFPFVAGAALSALSAFLIVECLRGRSEPGEAFGNVRGPALIAAGLILFVATLDILGYVLAVALLAAIMLFVFEVRRPLAYVIAVPIAAIGSYLLFDSLLGVSLPGGILGDWPM